MEGESFKRPSRRVGHQKQCSPYFKRCCVPFKGALLVLAWSLLLHSCCLSFYATIYSGTKLFILSTQIALIITLLLYPLAGLFAETRITRLRFMIIGTIVAMIGLILVTPTSYLFFSKIESDTRHPALAPLLILGLMLHQIGLGMFEANAIQFGVDQLQFASNEELSKFVNWYFWTMYALQHMISLLSLPLHFKNISMHMISGQAIFGIICIITALSIILICSCCNHILIEPTSRNNPVKLIWKVLNYARRHSQPLRRSAFTYGDPPPSRLDIAKERYGGPFTTEQIEDVKSFWGIFILLLILFGFSSLIYILQNLGDIVHNSDFDSTEDFHLVVEVFLCQQWIFYFVVISFTSAYLCLVRPLCSFIQRFSCWTNLISISMLRKIGIGMIMVCLAQILSAVSSAMMYSRYKKPEECILSNRSEVRSLSWTNTEKVIALFSLSTAQVFGGLGYVLVFLTALEFILAQAPRTLQGLLIGLWYAMQSLGVAIVLIIKITQVKIHCHYWPYIVLSIISIISLCLYTVVSYRFKYRLRQESSSIHYHYTIEVYTMKNLVKKEEAQRKREAELTVDDYNIIDD